MVTFFVIMYILALISGAALLGLCYFSQFSKIFEKSRLPWKKFYTNPGIVMIHLSWLYLVFFAIIRLKFS